MLQLLQTQDWPKGEETFEVVLVGWEGLLLLLIGIGTVIWLLVLLRRRK